MSIQLERKLHTLRAKKQLANQCGPYALETVARFWGKDFPIEELIRLTKCSDDGVFHYDLIEAATKIGFEPFTITGGNFELLKWLVSEGIPVLVGWWAYDGDHFSVVIKITDKYIHLADSESHLVGGHRELRVEQFKDLWWDTDLGGRRVKGWGVVLYPTLDLRTRTVDGAYVRANHDSEFGAYSRRTEGRYYAHRYIPEGQIWVEKKLEDEREFFKKLAILEEYHLLPETNFHEYREWVKIFLCDSSRFDIKKATKSMVLRDGYIIRFIDGEMVRKHFDPYFTFGGHDRVYKYIPKNEIWIDVKMPQDSHSISLEHEWVEWCLMGAPTFMTYDNAHDKATAAEHEYQRLQGKVLPGDEHKTIPNKNQMSWEAKKLVDDGFNYWRDA